jgi:hypothetical protein
MRGGVYSVRCEMFTMHTVCAVYTTVQCTQLCAVQVLVHGCVLSLQRWRRRTAEKYSAGGWAEILLLYRIEYTDGAHTTSCVACCGRGSLRSASQPLGACVEERHDAT